MRCLLNVILLLHHSQTIVLGAMMLPSSVADIPSAADATTINTLYVFNGLFSRTTRVSRYQKDKTSLDLNEARDYGVLGCSGIS